MAKKQSQVIDPLTLPVYEINEDGKVVEVVRDPLRTSAHRFRNNVLNGGDRNKETIAALSQGFPVVWRGGEHVPVLRVWIRIVDEDGNVVEDVSEEKPILVAELTWHQAALCGLAERTDDGNFSRTQESILVSAEWLTYGAKCRDFHGSLAPIANDLGENQFDREDADIFGDLTFIKRLREHELPEAFVSVALFGVGYTREDNLFADVQPGKEDVHPVWYALETIVEQGITTWGALDDGRIGEEEIYKLKLRFVNHLRALADWLTVASHWRLVQVAEGHTVGFPFLDYSDIAREVGDGFGFYGDPKVAEEAEEEWKAAVEALFRFVERAKDLDFAATLARIEVAFGEKKKEILKAFLRGDITRKTFFRLRNNDTGGGAAEALKVLKEEIEPYRQYPDSSKLLREEAGELLEAIKGGASYDD